jgi:hypothetical protein
MISIGFRDIVIQKTSVQLIGNHSRNNNNNNPLKDKRVSERKVQGGDAAFGMGWGMILFPGLKVPRQCPPVLLVKERSESVWKCVAMQQQLQPKDKSHSMIRFLPPRKSTITKCSLFRRSVAACSGKPMKPMQEYAATCRVTERQTMRYIMLPLPYK